eukprot:TRINITY_DN443_c1_g7_i1.p1 TRINITY_DN443_c1_g7~~TRINITY_DN443_c1_g7_i1.p1  ORF type:complete len:473 (-),score=110.31 TRINITY_DN443_c1_g7_i1:157-1575(-)
MKVDKCIQEKLYINEKNEELLVNSTQNEQLYSEQSSGNEDVFEGAEKKLYIECRELTLEKQKIIESDVTSVENLDSLSSLPISSSKDERNTLRDVSKEKWEMVLEVIGCRILNKTSNKYFDAYILSESSLFVYDYKILIKTCGETLLLTCLEMIMDILEELQLAITVLTFSRKNYLYPELQHFPHIDFQQEINFLNRYGLNGTSNSFGTESNNWNVYIYRDENSEYSLSSSVSTSLIEFMMTGLDSSKMKPFFESYYNVHDDDNIYQINHENIMKNNENNNITLPQIDYIEKISNSSHSAFASASTLKKNLKQISDTNNINQNCIPTSFKELNEFQKGIVATFESGLIDLFPSNTIIDSFFFPECGYSMNGLCDEHYFTIHITPETSCSYISFESSYPFQNNSLILQKLFNLFLPQSTISASFSSSPSSSSSFLLSKNIFSKSKNLSSEYDIQNKSFQQHNCSISISTIDTI